MAKRKGSPASRAGTSSQRESESKPSQKGMEDECDQLRREICALEATHDNLEVRYRPLFREDSREPKRAKLEEELEQVQQNLRTKREHLKLKEAEYTQSLQRLRKLPPEVWEKILDELDENDLFPLALSCRYFEQMQTVQEEVLRIKRMKIERMTKVAEDAARIGQLETLQRLKSKGYPLPFIFNEKTSEWAAKKGHLDVLKFLHENGCSWNEETCKAAAEKGHLDVLKYAWENGCPWDWRTWEGVKESTLEWLKAALAARKAENAKRLDKLPKKVWEKILSNLHENDLFPLARSCKYFRQKQKELVARTIQSGKPPLALKTTFLKFPRKSQPVSAEYLRFCSKEREEFTEDKGEKIMYLAAFHGHLPLLLELHNSSFLAFEIDGAVFIEACAGGNMDVVKGLEETGYHKLHPELNYDAAASHGHLEVLKWLRSEGCPWDASACRSAARGGHLEVLKWLRKEGCPWDERTCERAASRGHLDVLRWAIDNGCPYKVNNNTRPALQSLCLA